MSLEVKLQELFRNLNERYLDITRFLTERQNELRQLRENDVSPTDSRVVLLTNIIESTVKQLGDIAEAMREFRRNISTS